MGFKGMKRNVVVKTLKRGGYDWQEWNDDGTVLEAIKICAGVGVDRVVVNFTKRGIAM